jgi:hypothetical protein
MEQLFDVLETAHLNTEQKRTRGKTFFFQIRKNILPIGVHTHTVKVSDYTVWRYTWRINWVNCTVLTSRGAGLMTVFPVLFLHRELCSSLWESHSFLSLPADTTMVSSRKARNLPKWLKERWHFAFIEAYRSLPEFWDTENRHFVWI